MSPAQTPATARRGGAQTFLHSRSILPFLIVMIVGRSFAPCAERGPPLAFLLLTMT